MNRTAAFRVPGPRTRQVEPGEGSPVRADRGRASNDRGRRAGPLKSRPKNPVDPEKRRAPSRLFRVLLQYWLGPPLILTTSRLFCRPPPRAYARAPPPRCGRLQARRRTDLLTTISPLAIDLRGPFAARLDARALRRRCARTPKSGQLVPAARIDGDCLLIVLSKLSVLSVLKERCRVAHNLPNGGSEVLESRVSCLWLRFENCSDAEIAEFATKQIERKKDETNLARSHTVE